ncbi:unnamed protein product [Pneumocystis jirovecii]|uniref:ER membrane protein complex subunit 6 n=1 Tax=Pneumocystis jirovecii TaxID=42068 RepID=L0P9K8_PNEJI|nr:unnamed protein product [Pneumocystis jirovecii]
MFKAKMFFLHNRQYFEVEKENQSFWCFRSFKSPPIVLLRISRKMDKKNHEIHAIASDAVAHNFKIISHIRSVTSIFFGFVAGILNLTSHPSLYFLSHKDIWTKDIFSGLLSFILSCTLSYGLVHIYI